MIAPRNVEGEIAMLGRSLFAVAAVLSLAGPAAAETAPNVLAQAGLLGRWAGDCSQPASGQNIYTIYAIDAQGRATLTYDSGPGFQLTRYTIPNARRIAQGRVSYDHVNQRTGEVLNVVLAVTPTQIRVWSSRLRDGKVLVANGKFASGGADSPPQQRCN
jgi:hypothetical protein